MWNDFFYYTRSERRVICLLLFLFLLLGGIGIFLFWKNGQAEMSVCHEMSIDSFLQQVQNYEEKRIYQSKPSYQKEPVATVILHPFDPNVADSLLLRSLGIPGYVVRNILRYRAKGGVFRTEESFARVYGLEPELFRQLQPYLLLPQPDIIRKSVYNSFLKDTLLPVKLPEGSVVELNTADTIVLKQVPGIGSGRARMIVAYRQKLGGFVRTEQLNELSHWPDSLNRWFRCDTSVVERISVNRAGLDRLRNHPYMDFYKAKAILEYRRKRGKIKGLSQLALFQEFTEKDLERLSPYLSFE